MDRGAWQAAVHRVIESDMTEDTQNARTMYLLISLYLVILDINETQICVYIVIKIQSMPF